MAPSCPEEVDVFTVPHSRMKELVCKYLDMLTATNFANVGHLTKLLENLIKTFQEFIAHEQIENQFIMKKLKNKLRSLSIQNTAVCNCHKDNRLTDMLKFLQDGYKCTKKSELDRHNYGLQLRQALEDFTEDFLPHMEEEEEVFQPLLMQHFSFEELKQIKATVIQQHFKAEPEEVPEKCVADVKSCKPEKDVQEPVTKVTDLGIENLPDEILLKVFCHLNPLQLSRCAQVSRRWNNLAMDGSLWTQLYPVSWAKGDWNAKHGVDEEDRINVEKEMSSKAFDEDADIDETDDWDEEAREIKFQSSMLILMCKHLLPRVGRTIKHCDLAYSRGLTNGTLYKILSLCPNLEFLDLTQTRVSDLGFKGFKKASCGKMLRHLDLSGCLYITDLTLQRLSTALGQISCHMTKGEGQLVDHVTPVEDRVTESVNEDNGCEKCNENRKNEDKRGCMKVKTGKNIDIGKNGQEICQGTFSVSQSKEERFVEGTKECCDRGTSCAGDQGNQRARRNPECRCCHGNHKKEEKLSEQQHDKGELSQPNPTDEIQLNNGNKESQDRSWIKQGHSDKGESLRTSDNDISTESEGIMKSCTKTHQALPLIQEVKQISTKVDHQRDRDSCKQVVVETYTQQSNQLNIYSAEEIINQNTPGQTFLPGYIFQAWNMEKVTDTVTPNISQHPNESSVTSSVQACKTVPGNEGPEVLSRSLEFLSLSGCYQVTDTGLNYLTDNGGLPLLKHLDLSGCWNLGGDAVSNLVSTAVHLDPERLFYCDNILDGPYADTASGCQNLQCASRVCCRCGE